MRLKLLSPRPRRQGRWRGRGEHRRAATEQRARVPYCQAQKRARKAKARDTRPAHSPGGSLEASSLQA